ncbi:S-layer homology domain-containing protein [Candidatus Gracilibacteria bacterium]|nr:S-layer homology domain-containing protein [Candidatus Gracilibacteria bacterium]
MKPIVKKFGVGAIVFFFSFNLLMAPVAQAFSFPDDYDLVAILVEDSLYKDPKNFGGLFSTLGRPLESTTMTARINRYAIDIQNELDKTRAVIIQVDTYEKPENVASVLEKLYYEGDPAEPGRTAYLKGVVVIGDVPLPVVNKKGNRFISLFPYTDFKAPVYEFNPETTDFEPTGSVDQPQAEIWHGVIRTPISLKSNDGREMMARYFDKNHLYHVGDQRYTSFDEKMFFQDFIHEEENLNPAAYQGYLKYLDHMDDVAYKRYTKDLYKDLSGAVEEQLADDQAEALLLQQLLESQGIPIDDTKPQQPPRPDGAPAAAQEVDKNQIPDIMTMVGKDGRGGMSDTLMKRFYEVFSKYPGLVNDLTKYTGRWVHPVGDEYDYGVDSAVNIISAKDTYTQVYLKSVNTMVEKQIDQIVRRLQKNVTLGTITLQVDSVRRKDPNGFHIIRPENIVQAPEGPVYPDQYAEPIEFTNYSPAVTTDATTFLPNNPIDNETWSFPASINGYELGEITSVAQCTPYRGTFGAGSYSKVVELNRAFNTMTAMEYDRDEEATTGRTPEEKNNDYACYGGVLGGKCQGYEHFAGCFSDSTTLVKNPIPGVQSCFPDHATDPILDINGTRQIRTNLPEGFDDYRSCMNYRPKAALVKERIAADQRLEAVDDNYFYTDENAADPVDYNQAEKVRRMSSVPVPSGDPQPDDVTIFASTGNDPFIITMGDLLRAIGWNSRQNPQGWKSYLAMFLSRSEQQQNFSIPIVNAKIESVQLHMNRAQVKELSSVFSHVEPTTETLAAQAKNLIALDLPVDNPRNITFQDQNRNPQRIVYPDLFKVSSVDEYVTKLQELQVQLNRLPKAQIQGQPAAAQQDICVNCLTALVGNLAETTAADNGPDPVVTRANRAKVSEAINWSNMNIDEKHAFISTAYLDPATQAYIGETPKGYELSYFNGKGDARGYSFAFQAKGDGQSAVNNQDSGDEEDTNADDPNNPFDNQPVDPPALQGGYDLFSWSPPPVSPWWERMKEWSRGLKDTTFEFSFGEPQEAFYGDMDEQNKQELEQIQKQTQQLVEDPSKADQVQLSTVKRIEVQMESTTIAAGKRVQAVLVPKNSDGKVVNDEFIRVTAQFIGEQATKVQVLSIDDDPSAHGTQLTIIQGRAVLDFVAPDVAATMKLQIALESPELKTDQQLQIVPGAHLSVRTNTLALVADGQQSVLVNIEALDAGNNVINSLNGTAHIGLSDNSIAKLSSSDVVMRNGRGSVNFIVGKKTGTVQLNATIASINSGQLQIKLLPGRPVKLGLSSRDETLKVVAGGGSDIYVGLYDANGNVVNTNSAQEVALSLDQVSGRIAALASPNVRVANGVAKVRLSPRGPTGVVTITAQAPGLTSATFSIKAVKEFNSAAVSRMQPTSLVVALLGIPAGNIIEPDFLGGWFTMNGTVQAATTLTTQPQQFQSLVEITDTGALRLAQPGRIQTTFKPANNFTMLLRDNQLKSDVAEVSIVTRREGKFEAIERANDNYTLLADGIYLRKTTDNKAIEVDMRRGALRVVKDQAERLDIQTNGFLHIFDNDFSIRPRAGEFLTLEILDKSTVVAEIVFVQHFNQDVRVLAPDEETPSDKPGVYVKPLATAPQIKNQRALSGNSTSLPTGILFVDSSATVSGPSNPGFQHVSLEDSLTTFGVGFTEGNKFGLLFAAGEQFGEANRPYGSDAGIVLGDPTVSLNPHADGNSFTRDTGKLLYEGAADVHTILPLDYNSDGYEDILLVEGEDKIRLLQNNGSPEHIVDKGYIIHAKNGITDIAKLDINRDGQMDLAISTAQGCKKTDTCIDLYTNDRGAFVRNNLSFAQKDKVVTLKAADMNNDTYTDLILADTGGDISIIYNRRGTFDARPSVVGNVGLQIDLAKNLNKTVLINYPGMPPKDQQDPESVLNYKTFSFSQPNPAALREGFSGFGGGAGGVVPTVDTPEEYVSYDFIYVDQDPGFVTSTKFAQDINGGIVRGGDRIKYTLTLRNTSNQGRQNIMVSDLVSPQLQLDQETIQCLQCAQNELQVQKNNQDASYPVVLKGIRIPARSERTIVYETVYKGETASSEKITIAINNRFSDSNRDLQTKLRADNLMDLAVSKEGNPTGQVRYLYTTAGGWESQLSTAENRNAATDFLKEAGLNIPSAEDFALSADANRPSPAVSDTFESFKSGDKDSDGLPDTIDDMNAVFQAGVGQVNQGLDRLAGITSAAVNKLTCAAGCVALPVNYAFLAPGFVSVFGTPTSYDPGMPVFGWGVPSLVPVWPPSGAPAYGSLGGRFYISPTLTGGVGFSMCLGPFGTPRNCFSFGVNPIDLLPGNICDKINGEISGALSKANDLITDINGGMTLTIDGNGVSAGQGDRSSSGLANYAMGNYEPPNPSNIQANIRIPGFPDTLTDWWSRQLEEFTDKAFDLPDIYLIYPDIDSVVGSVKPTAEFDPKGDVLTEVLNYVNSIPLINIESQEVLFKIPLLTRNEIERFKLDALQWIEDEKQELDRWNALVGCFGFNDRMGEIQRGEGAPNPLVDPELCRIVNVEMNQFFNSIVENVKRLDEWILFPKKILQYRNIEAYYLGQVVDYLDTIIQFTGGWIKKNTARVKQWRAAVREIKRVLEEWKAMVDIMIEYQESCDTCKTERYGLKELILKLLIAIPKPPVIPLPKLPDFVIDVSKIQAGATIQWPDINFAPERIVLPKIPRISLGLNLTLPQWRLIAPTLPLIPQPPELPQLPGLPPLNLPQLPDLPPPPTMPPLPGGLRAVIDILKKVMKILCLIRLGFMPTDEFLLKARIEEITARGLTPLLPVDTMFTIQYPPITIEYVDQIVVTAFMNFNIEIDDVQKMVEGFAEKSNAMSRFFVGSINTYLQRLSKHIEQYTTPKLQFNLDLNKAVNYNENATPKNQVGIIEDLRKGLLGLNDIQKEYQEIADRVPKVETLVAGLIPYKAKAAGQQSGLTSQQLVADAGASDIEKELVAYRNSIAAYAQGDEHLGSNSLELPALIAQEKERAFPRSQRMLASRGTPTPTNGTKKVHAGIFDPEQVAWADGLIAQVPPGGAVPPGAAVPGMDGGQPEINNKGLFYAEPPLNEPKRLIYYTFEVDKESHLADLDIDLDGDRENVYSYGTDVYVKQNYKRAADPDDAVHFRSDDLVSDTWTILDLLPKVSRPHTPIVVSEAADSASFSFTRPRDGLFPIAGYDVEAKYSPTYFDRASATKTILSHIMVNQKPEADTAERVIQLVNADGQIQINNLPVVGSVVHVGDFITTGADSSVDLNSSDGTNLHLEENTRFVLSAGNFELQSGRLDIHFTKPISEIFAPGTVMRASSGELRLRFFDGSDVRLTSGQSFTLLGLQQVNAYLKTITNGGTITTHKREFMSSRNGKILLGPGDRVHPLQVVRINWDLDAQRPQQLNLSQEVILPVPENATAGLSMSVDAGMVEVIRADETGSQPLAAGMMIDVGDVIQLNAGTAVVHYAQGGETSLRAPEIFTLREMTDAPKPTIDLKLDPGAYFARVTAVDTQGNRSAPSEHVLLAPQVCGDSTPPFASFGKAEFTVSINKKLEMDGYRSFDSASGVSSYSLDTDIANDVNRDGNPANDPDVINGSNSKFMVGPFDAVGDKRMRLMVKDGAQNEGVQDILIHVVTPQLVLDVPPLKSNIITGTVTPPEADVPITIARFRQGNGAGGWEVLRTPSANDNWQYMTDGSGRFTIKDADMRDRLIVRDSENKIIAEINQKTGNITVVDERYEKRVVAARPPRMPTFVGVFLKTDRSNDAPFVLVYYVPDVNSDTIIDGNGVSYTAESVGALHGVHVKPLSAAADRAITFQVLPGDDENLPGATALIKNNARIATVDVNGDIVLRDAQLTLTQRPIADATANEPVVFEIKYSNTPVAEVYIATHERGDDKAVIVDALTPAVRPNPTVISPNNPVIFTDIPANDPFSEIAQRLYDRDIISGYSQADGTAAFKPDQLINRAEFVKITLNLLCIIPREEAKRLPTPFFDMTDPKAWYYPLVKEGALRKLVNGYLDVQKIDPVTGAIQTRFGAERTITRAEATKVIVSALADQGVIDISEANINEYDGAWYTSWIKIGQDLRPYLKKPIPGDGRLFVITGGEALDPNKQMTRRDFAIMADRVLLARDCKNPDADNDGMKDEWERQQGGVAMKPNDDADGDKCTNKREYDAGTDPRDPDTDNGGVNDCTELDRGTDPIGNPKDDLPQLAPDRAQNEIGIFILRPECGNVCPCRSSIGPGADLTINDIIFAAITGPKGLPIFIKSNEAKY